MDNLKRLKKGEFLFRENDAVQTIYVVQSGKISLGIERGGKRLEIMQAGANQVLGEQALFSSARHMFTAEAMQETKLMEVPVEAFKAQLNGAPAGVKLMLKSLVDEAKLVRQTLRSLKMESDKSPCPQPAIPRIFALLNLVARHTGKTDTNKPGEYQVDWGVLKLYATRMFAESPARIRSLMDLLLKLNLCELKIEKSEEGEEELKTIKVFNLQGIEDFAEFYQYNLYKGTHAEVIHVDPLAIKVAKVLVGLSEGVELDRKGAVTLNWDQVLEESKKKFGLELKGTHLDAIEKKGLFVKRQSRENAPAVLMFDRAEFVKTLAFWQIIYEIDKWNDKGFVDLKEKEVINKDNSGPSCPSCHGTIDSSHKFCPHCGSKIASAA